MHRTRTVARLLQPLLALWLVLPAVGQSADPAAWAPPEALVYIGISDVRQMFDQMERSAGMRMLRDPAAKQLGPQATAVTALIDGFKEGVAEALKTTPDNLKNPFAGNMALYALAVDGKPEEPVLAMVANIGDRETLQSYYQTATTRLREVAEQHEKIDFANQTIEHFVTRKAADDEGDGHDEGDSNAPGPGGTDPVARMVDQMRDQLFSEDALPPELAVCLTDDRFIAASNVDEVKAILRRDRTGENLAGSEAYRTLVQKFERAGPMRVVVNTPAFVKLMLAENTQEEARKWVSALGLEQFGPLVAHARYESAEHALESTFECFVPIRGERRGLARILSLENKPIKPPAVVTEDVMWYAWLNLDPRPMIEEIERITRAVDPAEAESFAASLGEVPAGEGTVHVRRDVIENLTGPLQFAAGFATPIAPESARVLFSIGHRNRETLRRVLTQMAPMMSLTDDGQEFAGNPVFGLPFQGVKIGLGGDALAIGDDASVQRLLQGDSGRTLAEAADFRTLAEAVGGEASAYFLIDPRRGFDAALTLAERREQILMGFMLNPAASLALSLAESTAGQIDPAKRDAVRSLRQYLQAGIVSVQTTPDGLLMRSATLRSR